MFLLAQYVPKSNSAMGSVILWSCILVAFLVVGFAILLRIRRRLHNDETPPSGATGFTLSDLRRMHKEGQISDEEMELTKSKIIEASRRAAERDAAKSQDNPRQRPPGWMGDVK